jgi:hypothetical protein
MRDYYEGEVYVPSLKPSIGKQKNCSNRILPREYEEISGHMEIFGGSLQPKAKKEQT